MIKQKIEIEKIPAILWGEKSQKLFIAVHGNMSHKEDDAIAIFAKEAIEKGYQVISFDLPEHGDRKNEKEKCKVQNCIKDLEKIMVYAKTLSDDISVFGCSMGAYFSLLAYRDEKIQKSLFLSPVVNMKRIITNMMTWFNISEDKLRVENEVLTPIGVMLYWDYYCYVIDNPINTWDKETSILYGAKDDLCEFEIIDDFIKKFNCNLDIMENGEHYFHTKEQLEFFSGWLKEVV
ncbi:MAG: alpha/beta hydrolase [Clostridium sp.]